MNSNNYNAFVINLDRDSKRYEAISKNLDDRNLPHTRIPALPGAYVPFFILEKFRMGANFASQFPGTFACFMSHIRAWEQADLANAGHNLFLEDDVTIGENYDSSVFSQLPSEYDLVFVNDRVCRHLSDGRCGSGFIPFATAMAVRPNWLSNPGGDGYILSKRGLGKILKTIKSTPLGRHVDQYLCVRSLDENSVKLFLAWEKLDAFFRHSGPLADESSKLITYCAENYFVTSNRLPESSRKNIDSNSGK